MWLFWLLGILKYLCFHLFSASGGSGFENHRFLRSADITQLVQWLPAGSTWTICFDSSLNGGTKASKFHQLCDGKGETVTLARVGTHYFGGYAAHSWTGTLLYMLTGAWFQLGIQYTIKDNLCRSLSQLLPEFLLFLQQKRMWTWLYYSAFLCTGIK